MYIHYKKCIKKKLMKILLTIVVLSEPEALFACAPVFVIEGELCEGDTISFISVSILLRLKTFFLNIFL